MTLDDERKKELDELWLESLLEESLHPALDRDKDRIQLLFAKPDFESSESHSAVVIASRSIVRWLPLMIAASVLIALSSWSLFTQPNQHAYAAISRSLQPTPEAREYTIGIRAKLQSGDEVTKTAQLFLGKSNQFAVHRQGWLGLSDIWVGSDGTNQWFVPRIGPALQGSERILGGWLVRKDATSPYLHLNTVLKRMEKNYELHMLPDTNLDAVEGDGKVVCEHIHGLLNAQGKSAANRTLPADIELWVDKETGIARRVILAWNREAHQAGPIQWTIELKRYPRLSENWFEPSGHLGMGQRVLSIGNEADLDAFPRSSDEQ